MTNKTRIIISVTLLAVCAFLALIFTIRDDRGHAENMPVFETTAVVTEAAMTEPVEPADIIPEPTETIHIEATEEPSEAPSAPVSEETISEVDPYELELLAIVIYQEAGGNKSCDLCRRRVADVVLNRVAHPKYPDTIEKVLLQKSQYGRLHWTGIKWPKRAQNKYEQEAVARAYRIAEEVLRGEHSDLYGEGYVYQAEFKQGKSGFWHCGHYWGKR
jgi:hypothetical protein